MSVRDFLVTYRTPFSGIEPIFSMNGEREQLCTKHNLQMATQYFRTAQRTRFLAFRKLLAELSSECLSFLKALVLTMSASFWKAVASG